LARSKQGSNRRRHTQVTASDVARLAGVSPMTVSRVVNGEASVRESTRDAVSRAIRKLGYSPNKAARSLAAASDVQIGLLYANPSSAYLSATLLGVLEQALHQGRRDLRHLLGGRLRGDDLGVAHQHVAVAVIPVCMRVDERADARSRGRGTPHLGEHLAREREVEQGIDEQRGAGVGHQSGVAPAPAPIGLKEGETAVSQLVKPLRVGEAQLRGHRSSGAGSTHARCARKSGIRPRISRAVDVWPFRSAISAALVAVRTASSKRPSTA